MRIAQANERIGSINPNTPTTTTTAPGEVQRKQVLRRGRGINRGHGRYSGGRSLSPRSLDGRNPFLDTAFYLLIPPVPALLRALIVLQLFNSRALLVGAHSSGRHSGGFCICAGGIPYAGAQECLAGISATASSLSSRRIVLIREIFTSNLFVTISNFHLARSFPPWSFGCQKSSP